MKNWEASGNKKLCWKKARKHSAALNEAFMELVNCKENPLTREDLEVLCRKRPGVYGRFAGFLPRLPSVSEVRGG